MRGALVRSSEQYPPMVLYPRTSCAHMREKCSGESGAPPPSMFDEITRLGVAAVSRLVVPLVAASIFGVAAAAGVASRRSAGASVATSTLSLFAAARRMKPTHLE